MKSEQQQDPGAADLRGMPFWAWNTGLDAERIREQIGVFAEMGFGGFVIHSRNGLRTPYLGKTYLEMVRLAVACARQRGMKVWIYDEDRWPSGCAGGLVTAERRFRQKSLLFTRERRPCVPAEQGMREGRTYLLAAYAVSVDREGILTGYRVTDPEHADLYAYVVTTEGSPRFNGQAYVDTLNPEAVARFIELTYEVYREALGEELGKTVEAFFTDEPQVIRLPPLRFSQFDLFTDTGIPWTDRFPESFRASFGEDPVPRLPELLWDTGRPDQTFRYRYNEHIAALFRSAYAKQIGDWCAGHGVRLTGHFLYEDSLTLQSASTRDVMRCYAEQGIPGIDILRGNFEFATVVQCASVARQTGRPRVMSELYGVTGWTADFRDYIHQGNWQAALGVNLRVPHLAWMSMRGEGKRDYPACFGYQSPWYREYRMIEEAFARLGSALACGEPVVRIGVIHPIESYWLLCGARDRTGRLRHARNTAFRTLCEWLLFGGFPFDFLSEALLPELFREEDGRALVGRMRYDAVVVPDCLTLRGSTVAVLERMRACGVRVIFAGGVPAMVDARIHPAAGELAARCERTEATREALFRALEPLRAFALLGADGEPARNYIHCEQREGEERIFFLTPARRIEHKEDTRRTELLFRIAGCYTPQRLDPLTGETRPPPVFYADGYTWVRLLLGAYDAVLLRLRPGLSAQTSPGPPDPPAPPGPPGPAGPPPQPIAVGACVDYRRAEDNVLLLDMAEYSSDGVRYAAPAEILQIDAACRRQLQLPSITGKAARQPWSVTDDREYPVWLRYSFDSRTEAECLLGAERLESAALNGRPVDLRPVGWYVDRDIHTFRLPPLRKGRNQLTVVMKLGKINGLEPMYLLGDFDVCLRGTAATLLPPSAEIGFGSVVSQGMPFYGGSLIYRLRIRTPKGRLTVSANDYAGALVKVGLDGRPVGSILLPPYRIHTEIGAGTHELELECVGNRHNTFGSLHWGISDGYYGPAHWHKEGDAFSREYRLADFGILKCPIVTCEPAGPQQPG